MSSRICRSWWPGSWAWPSSGAAEAASSIRATSPSLCAVADSCTIHLDRRLTRGETLEGAVAQVEALPSVKAAGAKVTVLDYARASYTGLTYPVRKYYPTWTMDEDHPAIVAAARTAEAVLGKRPRIDKWGFSTNGVATCGLFGVPPAMIGIADGKYNNTQTMLDEFYKSTMYPLIVNVRQKLKQHLLVGYPSLCVEFDTQQFLQGAPIDQMNYVVAGVNAGILTPNEAREYLGKPSIDGNDGLEKKGGSTDPLPGSSPQDTGGGGGNQKRRANIGTT